MWGTPREIDVFKGGRPVHPHACGEHWRQSFRSGARIGSSPRMWGTHETDRQRAIAIRFIPTHVGNTANPGLPSSQRTVHPHACGEHMNCTRPSLGLIGSSPRMWGTLLKGGRLGLLRRFIPTHVGNTVPLHLTHDLPPVHPHACGEHRSLAPGLCQVSGSSPRMWGTHLPYRIVFKEEKTPRKIYRLILYSVVRSRGWNATNCSPSNNTGCRRLTPRVWNS